MDSKSINHAQAEAFLAVINTLNEVDVNACVVSVSEHYGDLQVALQIGREDTATVDMIGTRLHLGAADPRDLNYTRGGDVLLYGHPLSLRVYCGRPVSMRASVDLSKVVAS